MSFLSFRLELVQVQTKSPCAVHSGINRAEKDGGLEATDALLGHMDFPVPKQTYFL